MSEQIKRQLSRFFILRMQWWARYASAGGVPIQSAFPTRDRVGILESVPGPRVPLLLGIVHDTDVAIDALERRYAVAVKVFWLREGLSLRRQASILAELLPVRYRRLDYHTLQRWVLQGHELLKAEFARSRACDEADENEALVMVAPDVLRIRVHFDAYQDA